MNIQHYLSEKFPTAKLTRNKLLREDLLYLIPNKEGGHICPPSLFNLVLFF